MAFEINPVTERMLKAAEIHRVGHLGVSRMVTSEISRPALSHAEAAALLDEAIIASQLREAQKDAA